MNKGTLIALLSALIVSDVFAVNFLSDKFIKQQLNEFYKDSESFMNSPAPKSKTGTIFFDHHSVSTSAFVKAKADTRRKFVEIKSSNKSSYSPNDRVEALVDTKDIIRSLETMETKNLKEGRVITQPWSDDYWPIYKGILGARYADMEFDFLGEWDEANDYVKNNPAFEIFTTSDFDLINLLSPSEKYDYLMGDQTQALTKKMWADGKYYFDEYGEVETWMGICHGWAPASYMLARPTKKITVMAFDGKTEITFYPSDIKALASLLWANVRTATKFVGGRCSSHNPEVDDNGRVIEEDCNDTNPGTWHMSVVNQIGITKASMVMDATYDYEVWNQPVVSYSYKYFNPITRDATDDLNQAKILVKDHTSDKFKDYRAPEAKYLVGVSMQVEYSVEVSPVQRDVETSEFDATSFAYYMYDLEINDKNEIIGGEWYRNTHPDFLWTPPVGTRAITYADYYLLGAPNWDGKNALPSRWRELGIKSAKRGQPLAKVVESLIELSNI